MAKRMISPHDLELLSAYLDHQLPPDQQARLETRLQQEPDLQSEYEALRRVQRMVRSLPRRRAPRNFTLTPAMVGVRPRPAARLGWGWVSALATVLLLLVLIGDLVVIPEYVGFFPQPRLLTAREAAQEAAPEAAQEVAQQPEALSLPEDTPAESAPEEALVFPTEATQAEEPEARLFAEEAGAPTPQATPTVAEAPVLADQLPPTEEAMQAMESSRAMEATSTPPATMKQAPTPTATTAEALALQSAPAETAEAATQSGEAESALEAPPRQPTLWVQVVFWMAELLLVILAVGAGALAVYSRFRRFP